MLTSHYLAFTLLLLLWLVPTARSFPNKEDCLRSGVPILMWTRGLARYSGQIYPNKMSKHEGGFFEAGSKDDPHYIYKSKMIDGDVVYVATADFPYFLEKFAELPKKAKIVLITGSEDIGTPFELFHPSRNYRSYNMQDLWPRGQIIDMETFLLDPRLKKWFAQNYDLVGCNHYTCSSLTRESVARDDKHQQMVRKVEPIPIGLDLHTLIAKRRKASRSHKGMDGMVCDQLREMYSISHAKRVVPFAERAMVINAEFTCDFKLLKGAKFRELTRGKLCKLTNEALVRGDRRYHRKERGEREGTLDLQQQKRVFWTRLTKVAFAFAPPGYGMDTHRAWEILSMRTVPIVIASPLDALHEQFPVVIVEDWQEAFEEGALERFKKQIIKRWGMQPFGSDVMTRLGLEYWIDLVNNASQS